ncbi:MAG: hypothetical protein CL933_23750 [Deltaproteobacteria bacterium]|nr:hypothetical protein [Deltaproteobacteria bacterium]
MHEFPQFEAVERTRRKAGSERAPGRTEGRLRAARNVPERRSRVDRRGGSEGIGKTSPFSQTNS